MLVLKRPQLATAFILTALMAGCATTRPPTIPQQTTAHQNLPFTLDALPAQRLAPGGCELFLFTPRPEPRFVFFADIESGVAKMSLNGDLLSLVSLDEDGSGFFDPEATHRFAHINGQIEIIISLHRNKGTGGRSSGVLRIRRQDGWMQIAPVSGVSTCGLAGLTIRSHAGYRL